MRSAQTNSLYSHSDKERNPKGRTSGAEGIPGGLASSEISYEWNHSLAAAAESPLANDAGSRRRVGRISAFRPRLTLLPPRTQARGQARSRTPHLYKSP